MSLRSKLIAAFVAAGISASSAYVAYDLTLPSEGLVHSVYKDPVGLPTVCVGHMDRTLKPGTTMTTDECMALLAQDWIEHERLLDSVVVSPYKSEWQKAALVDFTFNLGIGNVRSSTLIRLLNQGQHDEACKQLTRWVYANGKKLNGLVTRRNATMIYCMGEISWSKKQAFEEFQKEYQTELENQSPKQ